MRKNLIAAYSGMLLNMLLPLIVTPFVLKALGMEAYGLIGIGLMLQSILAIMEVGLSASLSRAFAQRTAALDDTGSHAGMHDLLRTLEYFYLALVGFVCLLVLLVAPLIARYWITDHGLPYEVVWQSIALIGLMIAVRFFVSLYGGGLAGLQRQVILNTTSIILNVIANIGAVVVLFWVSSDPRAYFSWLALMGALSAITLRFVLTSALPVVTRPARFDWDQWQSIRKFSVGISSLTVTSLALTQTDKLLLSRLLPLRDFGFYSIASTVASVVQLITIPVQTVYYPRMTQCQAKGDTRELIDIYRFASRMVALLVFPLGFTLALFSQDILLLWLRDPLVGGAGPCDPEPAGHRQHAAYQSYDDALCLDAGACGYQGDAQNAHVPAVRSGAGRHSFRPRIRRSGHCRVLVCIVLHLWTVLCMEGEQEIPGGQSF
jgi:O-antigen/teichoic acid export membrane protein